MIRLADQLQRERWLSDGALWDLIEYRTPELARELALRASAVRDQHYGNRVFLRGLIEFTNVCKNNCFYCGLRSGNHKVARYRLTPNQILGCCKKGYRLGFRSFVLQGGEDPMYTPDQIASLVAGIKAEFPDCAVTLSVGEYPREVYQGWREAGADRYLLRHETADAAHYEALHPKGMHLSSRLDCLADLKALGYQVGCGFMVGSPGQRTEHIVKDLQFIRQFRPHMVGIGPFIPQKDTPFGAEPAGNWELTVYLLSILRLMLPQVLLPATTALGTVHPQGRELGLLAGANVCMPNLSPTDVRKDYALYDDKICTGEEAAESVHLLRRRIEGIGMKADMGRGDHFSRKECRYV